MKKKDIIDKATKSKYKLGINMIKKPISKRRTLKQDRFIDNYLESGNATDAVKKAGYKIKNSHVAESI